ncbi:MFS transporter [Sporomusa acidovorans]|uniref:Major facilitator superfamily (MFS) profile domain-containing protein n=1 Tax=Sporomusa acidovorans (strain ATCC 49682 / DSM 3132 / Mol) TaxID=1123286 RepID=A0ABZ3IZ07_SPOA4|nr:MFS transporter [Sporomusa acidovorans]OZC16818.1 putative glucarate transporter [Sporomusa acidovorans DSM 3132]SDF87637.1 Sugar phosphate permease [Sporomusa acidovorans]
MVDADKQRMFAKLKRYQWPMYIIVILAYMLTLFHRITPAVMGPELMKDLQLDAVAFGFLGLAFTWTYAIAQAPVGALLDKFGARRGLTIILILAVVGSVVFAAGQNFVVVVIGRIIIALAVAGFLIGGAKIVAAWFTSAQYPVLWGLFMGFGALGSVFATTPLQYLMTSFGWRGSIYIVAGLSIVLTIIAYTMLRDRPSDVGLVTPDELAGVTVPQVKADTKHDDSQDSLKGVLAMPMLWLIGLLSLGVNSSAQTLQSLWNGIYLADVYAFSKPVISDILFYSAIGLVVGSFLSGWAVRIFNSARTMTIGTTAFLLVWLYMTVNIKSMSIAELKAVNFCYGFLQMVTIATTFTFIKELVPQSRLGTAMGVVNSFAWIFGAGLFQQIWGLIIKSVSNGVKPYPVEAFQTAFWVQVIVLVIGAACAFYILKTSSKSTAQKSNQSKVPNA